MTMMRIATTRSQEMQALRLGGQRVVDAAAAISAMLSRSLSPEHAALFAEPEGDAERGEIDWYAEVEGPVTTLADLPEPAQSTAQQELNRLTTDISTLASRLSASQEANERRIGELLMLALNVPAPYCIKVTGGQPVLIGWGHRSADANNLPMAIQGMTRVKPEAPERPMEILPPPPVMRGGAGARPMAWGWLALALALLIIGLGLLDHDLFLLQSNRVCQVNRADLASLDHWRQAQAQGAALQAELEGLQKQANAARCNCPQTGSGQPGGAPPGGAQPLLQPGSPQPGSKA